MPGRHLLFWQSERSAGGSGECTGCVHTTRSLAGTETLSQIGSSASYSPFLIFSNKTASFSSSTGNQTYRLTKTTQLGTYNHASTRTLGLPVGIQHALGSNLDSKNFIIPMLCLVIAYSSAVNREITPLMQTNEAFGATHARCNRMMTQPSRRVARVTSAAVDTMHATGVDAQQLAHAPTC